MSQTTPEHSLYILPERAVDLAWGLTLASSSSKNEALINSADDLHNRLKQIQLTVQQQVSKKDIERNESKKALEDALKNGSPNIAQLEKALDKAEASFNQANKDLSYTENVLSAIAACNRNIVSLISNRNQNFQQTDSLMASEIANIESSARLTANLQSLLPRLFATGGGASGTIVVNYILQSAIGYTIPVEVLAAVATIVAAGFYGLFQWKFAPRNVVRSQQEIIKNSYRRDIYYRRYVERVVSSLEALFDQTLSIYKTVYGYDYDPMYDDVQARKKVAWDVLGGKDGVYGRPCPHIHKHYLQNKITPETWASCQSGEGYQTCMELQQTTAEPNKTTRTIHG